MSKIKVADLVLVNRLLKYNTITLSRAVEMLNEKASNWIELTADTLPIDGRVMILEIQGSYTCKEIAIFDKSDNPQLLGTFTFLKGTRLHFWKNIDSSVKRYLYLNDI